MWISWRPRFITMGELNDMPGSRRSHLAAYESGRPLADPQPPDYGDASLSTVV